MAEQVSALCVIRNQNSKNNFDNYLTIGIYGADFYQKENSPSPNDYTGTLIVIKNSHEQYIQIAIVNTIIYLRMRSNSAGWTAWRTI